MHRNRWISQHLQTRWSYLETLSLRGFRNVRIIINPRVLAWKGSSVTSFFLSLYVQTWYFRRLAVTKFSEHRKLNNLSATDKGRESRNRNVASSNRFYLLKTLLYCTVLYCTVLYVQHTIVKRDEMFSLSIFLSYCTSTGALFLACVAPQIHMLQKAEVLQKVFQPNVL